MNILNFASYAKSIKKGIPKASNVEITRLLLNFIVEKNNVVNSKGGLYNINDSYSSLWWNQREDIPAPIKKAAALPEIISEATDYFEDKIINALSPQKDLDTYVSILELIKVDSSIAKDNKNHLISLYEANEIGQFLAQTFLYALQKDNKSSNKTSNTTIPTTTSITDDVNKLTELLKQYPKPVQLIPQDTLDEHEMIYITELLAAYADAEGLSEIEKNNLDKYPKYKKNFARQRKDYYAAETIRQSARDPLGLNATDEFNILKEETLDGIIDVHEDCYSSGFERLNNVMKHVTTIQLNKSWLTRLPGWISNSEKKGFCHMLVNDRQITWVDEDE
ncbi:ABC-three component system protein [uncultured Clostridium sp.]|uniref:ABC-three component system protein n=1 Tax=uncultured Clostridium sp. TaxID=59620 RepID=UPI002670D105|nr:ABC-three component system protein [uncultured Clostridium sp.]